MKYVFLGTQSIVGDLVLNQFGQVVELTEEGASDAILGGCALLPQADYDAVMKPVAGSLDKLTAPASHRRAPEEFQVAKKQALEKLHANREKLHENRAKLENPPEPAAAKPADKTPARADTVMEPASATKKPA